MIRINTLTDLQKKLLEMLDAFHSICIDNGLLYYALGGTVIGALRHDGFIPWDDDIDIGMPRKDYNTLRELYAERIIKKKYILETPDSKDRKYFFPYCKFYDASTTLIENTRNRLIRGVFLDIFPLDGLGMTYFDCKKNYKPIAAKMNLLDLRKIRIDNSRPFYKNAILFAAQKAPNFIINEKRLCIEIDKLCQKYAYSEMNWGGNLLGAWRFREVMPISVFGKPVLHRFEDSKICIPEKADEYLTRQYGDWKTLPPLEKRVSHHDFYLNLDQGYLKDDHR